MDMNWHELKSDGSDVKTTGGMAITGGNMETDTETDTFSIMSYGQYSWLIAIHRA